MEPLSQSNNKADIDDLKTYLELSLLLEETEKQEIDQRLEARNPRQMRITAPGTPIGKIYKSF